MYAARPSHSEHQTALAIDITSLEHPYDEDFNESSPINNEIPEPEPINTNMNNQ